MANQWGRKPLEYSATEILGIYYSIKFTTDVSGIGIVFQGLNTTSQLDKTRVVGWNMSSIRYKHTADYESAFSYVATGY